MGAAAPAIQARRRRFWEGYGGDCPFPCPICHSDRREESAFPDAARNFLETIPADSGTKVV